MNIAANFDIIGGAVDASAALQRARRAELSLIIDKDAIPSKGSSGVQTAICHFKYSHREIVEFFHDGIAMRRNLFESFSFAAPYAHCRSTGSVWLGQPGDTFPANDAERISAFCTLDDQAFPERLLARKPSANPPDFKTDEDNACEDDRTPLCEFDASRVASDDESLDIIATAKARHICWRLRTLTTEILVGDGRATGIRLERGEKFDCAHIIYGACSCAPSLLGMTTLKP